MNHDLIQQGPRQYECRTCRQTWRSIPRSDCLGARLYPQYACGGLLTASQLDYVGYHTTNNRLPTPAGYYRDYAGRYIPLYDPAQAIKKRARRRPTKICVLEICWPLNCVPFLEHAVYLRQSQDSRCYQAMRDVAQMAFQFLHFSTSEIEQNTGGAVKLVIPPMLIHRFYPTFSVQNLE